MISITKKIYQWKYHRTKQSDLCRSKSNQQQNWYSPEEPKQKYKIWMGNEARIKKKKQENKRKH